MRTSWPPTGEKTEFNLDKADAGADDNAAEDAARPTRRIGWDSLPEELRDKTIGYKEYPLYVGQHPQRAGRHACSTP